MQDDSNSLGIKPTLKVKMKNGTVCKNIVTRNSQKFEGRSNFLTVG